MRICCEHGASVEAGMRQCVGSICNPSYVLEPNSGVYSTYCQKWAANNQPKMANLSVYSTYCQEWEVNSQQKKWQIQVCVQLIAKKMRGD